MLKNKFVILMFLFLVATTGYGQQMDTALILKHLKIRLLTELDLGLLKETALNDFLKRELNATVLKSKGFENFVFFKIGSQTLAIDTIKEGKKIATYTTPACLKNAEECCFVYAFNKNNKGFYRVKGTKSNDFLNLYNSMEQWQYWKVPAKINESTINQFIKDYWVDGLDLACLLRSLTGKTGNCLDYFSHLGVELGN
ncbi:MAG: hypothetical protein H7331_04530 [Bacteroidia bacterium]|nr:hypothetical protein [Bacteroidia bacterium]